MRRFLHPATDSSYFTFLYWLQMSCLTDIKEALLHLAFPHICEGCGTDVLPVSACESMACTPYLLEACGFDIEAVELMVATNQLQCTRTKRYVVLARKIP